MDTNTGEFQEKRLAHREEAEKLYRGLAATSQKVRVEMEASGHARWLERLLAELQFEFWIGDTRRSEPTEYASRRRIAKMLVLASDFANNSGQRPPHADEQFDFPAQAQECFSSD